jgi:hypothetical protein
MPRPLQRGATPLGMCASLKIRPTRYIEAIVWTINRALQATSYFFWPTELHQRHRFAQERRRTISPRFARDAKTGWQLWLKTSTAQDVSLKWCASFNERWPRLFGQNLLILK